MCTHLSAHEDVDDGVVGGARLGEKGRDNGEGGRDHALPAEGLHHGHHCIRRPAHQEAGDHEQEHDGHFLLVAQDLNDLHGLEVLDGAELYKQQHRPFKPLNTHCVFL